ncbi:MAG: glycosyltransferase [Vicinamibacteria bacterium]|nr:glycosyltransferase [Vicinamibacteria bacterium]
MTETPISVLHVCDKFGVSGSSIHGVSRLFSWWFPRFSPAFQVSLCGLKSPEPASRWLEEQGIPVVHFGRGPFDPRIIWDLFRLARRKKARILHVHGYAAANFGRVVASLIGARLVLHEHFADPCMPFYQGLADRMLASLVDGAIAVSESTREFLARERFVRRDYIRLIYNGSPLRDFAPAPPAPDLRASLGLNVDDFVIGTIGRLNLQKGHRYLLDAAGAVIASRKNVRFLIIGDGDQEDVLKEQSRRQGIAANVVFAGHRTDIPQLLAAIDVFCISSIYEGTPLTLFEAMAAAKPIVSTSVDGCREILNDGKSGLLVPPRDPNALAEALMRVIRSRDLRETLAQGARDASSRYEIEDCVHGIECLYHDLIRGNGGR